MAFLMIMIIVTALCLLAAGGSKFFFFRYNTSPEITTISVSVKLPDHTHLQSHATPSTHFGQPRSSAGHQLSSLNLHLTTTLSAPAPATTSSNPTPTLFVPPPV
ncbi:hypothetical protein DFH27DRAFT_597282 [Peziza echinospora]|nr:hypothetical protein DFH27DRAFT_597282 [Peziza echinospora]